MPDDRNTTKDLEAIIAELHRTVKAQEAALKKKDEEIRRLKLTVAQRESSASWKLSQAYGRFFSTRSPVTGALRRLLGLVVPGIKRSKGRAYYKAELDTILEERRGKVKGIILYPPVIDWNVPLFQRPQQLALELSKLGYLFFFSTPNALYDDVDGFQRIADDCFVTDQYGLLRDELPGFILYITSTDTSVTIKDIRRMRNKKMVMYDYIDEIHQDITGRDGLGIALKRHEYMKKNAEVFIASAGSLYEEAGKARAESLYLIPNAADYTHFHIRRNEELIPPEMGLIRDKKRPVVGYYGAISKWIDYDLIKYVARSRPYEIVLIGLDYDGSIHSQGLDKLENVHYLGPQGYDVLPEYAAWFDACLIPFVRNEITDSTSPIKLFEYMALGHPIVSTDIRECRKYRSVLIGKGPEDFAKRLDEALALKGDPAYAAVLEKEAAENTWKHRAEEIAAILEK